MVMHNMSLKRDGRYRARPLALRYALLWSCGVIHVRIYAIRPRSAPNPHEIPEA